MDVIATLLVYIAKVVGAALGLWIFSRLVFKSYFLTKSEHEKGINHGSKKP